MRPVSLEDHKPEQCCERWLISPFQLPIQPEQRSPISLDPVMNLLQDVDASAF
jgi:hypothetical protein